MVRVPGLGGSKLIEYRLVDGKRNTVAAISASEWKLKTPPGKEDFADDMEDGVYYRLVKVYKKGEKEDWVDVWTQGGFKKRKGVGSNDLRGALNAAAEPMVALAEFATNLAGATENLYAAFHGGRPADGSEDQPTGDGSPKSELELMKAKLAEMSELQKTFSSFMGYDPRNPQFPQLQFGGNAPWYLHPWILSYGQQFVSGVLNDVADAAQNFGYKFRQGMSGVPPAGKQPNGQPAPQGQPPQPDPTLFEDDSKELEERMARLEERRKEMEGAPTPKIYSNGNGKPGDVDAAESVIKPKEEEPIATQ